MPQSANRVRTAEIGGELARLIRSAVPSPQLKVVQYGGLERLSGAPAWDELLPAVFVDPQEANYAEDGGLDVGNIQSLVTETFRIVHFFQYAPAEDIQATAAKNVAAILKPLTDDASLTDLGNRIRADRSLPGFADQISWSAVQAIEWHPDEQVFFVEAGQRVKVVVFRWQVRWYNRM